MRDRHGRIPAVAAALALVGVLGTAPAPARAADAVDPALYAELLRDYTRESGDVAGTRVDYKGLARSSGWRKLLHQLGRSRPDQLSGRDETLAFWINAYNILAIQMVIANYPVESIRDIGSFLRPVWDRDAGRIGGRDVTLGEIEHEILRKLDEPRIHVAIVCASTSCPSLAREPFTAEGLDAQLDAATRRFVADPAKGSKIDREAKRVTLSKIFDWFEEDFEDGGGTVAFVAAHLDGDDRRWLEANRDGVRVRHFDYDWTLNDTARAVAGEAGGN